jgi:hypothetical protein
MSELALIIGGSAALGWTAFGGLMTGATGKT